VGAVVSVAVGGTGVAVDVAGASVAVAGCDGAGVAVCVGGVVGVLVSGGLMVCVGAAVPVGAGRGAAPLSPQPFASSVRTVTMSQTEPTCASLMAIVSSPEVRRAAGRHRRANRSPAATHTSQRKQNMYPPTCVVSACRYARSAAETVPRLRMAACLRSRRCDRATYLGRPPEMSASPIIASWMVDRCSTRSSTTSRCQHARRLRREIWLTPELDDARRAQIGVGLLLVGVLQELLGHRLRVDAHRHEVVPFVAQHADDLGRQGPMSSRTTTSRSARWPSVTASRSMCWRARRRIAWTSNDLTHPGSNPPLLESVWVDRTGLVI
jgi:hypothetical protein